MAVTYPATLPAPFLKSINIRRQKTTRRLDFDAGTSRLTNHASNAPYIVDCEFRLDAVQMEAFEYFFKFTANFGVNWIDAAWPASLGFDSHYWRFLSVTKIIKSNSLWLLPCIIEIQAQSIAIDFVGTTWQSSNLVLADFPVLDNLSIGWAADTSNKQIGESYASGEHFYPDFGLSYAAMCLKSGWGAWGPSMTMESFSGFKGVQPVNFSGGGYISYQALHVTFATNAATKKSFVAVFSFNGGEPMIGGVYSGGQADSVRDKLGSYRYGFSLTQNDVKIQNFTSNTISTAFSTITARVVVYVEFPAVIGGEFKIWINGLLVASHVQAEIILSQPANRFFIASGVEGKNTGVHEFYFWEDRYLTDDERNVAINRMKLKWQIE